MTTDKSSSPRPSHESGHINGIFVAIALIVIAVVGALAVRHYFSPADIAAQTATVDIGGPFELVDQDGRTVTDVDFHGRYMLIYFGYTYCPDICPVSLLRNIEALDSLGSDKEEIVPVLITVDPARDTPPHLKEYVGLFDPRMVGLTGSDEQVADAAAVYRVYYAKVEEPGADPDAYLVDHSGFTYLMGPDGQFVQFFRHDMSADDMAARLREALS